MDIDLIRTFLAICENRSFTGAARQVGRTQSAVSLQVKRMEESLGRTLFIRDKSPIELTAHGQKFVQHARRILTTYDEAMANFDREEVVGSVVLGVPGNYTPRILPTVLREFVEIHPSARVDIVVEESPVLARRLAEGAIDMAFLTKGLVDTNDKEVVIREPMRWVVAKGSDAHLRDPLPLAIWSENDCSTDWMRAALGKMKRPYRFAATSPDNLGLVTVIGAGLAVSAVTECSVQPGMLVLAEADGFAPLPILELVLERAPARRSRLVNRLRSHLVSTFRNQQTVFPE